MNQILPAHNTGDYVPIIDGPERASRRIKLKVRGLPIKFSASGRRWLPVFLIVSRALAGTNALADEKQNTYASEHSLYVVDKIALGERLVFTDNAYREYRCQPSKQFKGFTWCTKASRGDDPRGSFGISDSILHAQDGVVAYVSRFQTPAFWSNTEVTDDIQRYATKLGERPRVVEMPSRPGLPYGKIAIWGKVVLEALDQNSLKELAARTSVKQGLLIDFIGDFSRSAREGLPVYRIAGGPGFVWVASYNDAGRGTLRFCAVNPTAYSPPASVIKEAPTGSLPNSQLVSSFRTPDRVQIVPPHPSVGAPDLSNNQLLRDSLFKDLQTAATKYNFEYVVITLPPGTLPGLNTPVPVSHVRFSDTVFFAFDQYSLLPGAQAAVLDFARTMKHDQSYRSIVIVGHTDAIGTEEYNFNLSKNRASAVALALRKAGLNSQFLGIVPMGKEQPVATNSTDEGRARNRRVEFFISDVPGAPEAAIERIKFNPCYRNDNESLNSNPESDCQGGTNRIPELSSSGQSVKILDLTRNTFPTDPHPSREPLPDELIQRPSVREPVE